VLSRADLIAIARTATDGFAGGGSDNPAMLAFEGRRFQLRLPFGCAGPSAEEEESLRWRYDEETGTLRANATPVAWAPADWLAPEARAAVERMEGFWIERPWTSSEACPPQPSVTPGRPAATPAASAPVPAPETLGLAMFAFANASRVGRRPGEAFALVRKVAPEDLDLSRGLRLRLTGRIASAPGAGPVLCRALAGANRRPTCLIGVVLEEVAVENGASGETLATWTISGHSDQRGLTAAPVEQPRRPTSPPPAR
jgi:hypothetical protein